MDRGTWQATLHGVAKSRTQLNDEHTSNKDSRHRALFVSDRAVVFELTDIFQSLGFPGGSDGKKSACNAEDPGSISRSGRAPGEGTGNPLQYSCLGNPKDRGAWRATVRGVTKRWVRLSN